MIPHLWLAYVPAFIVFIFVARFKGVGSRWTLGVAGLALIGGFLFILETILPIPKQGFLNWLPWLVLAATLVSLLSVRFWCWGSLFVFIFACAVLIPKVLSINSSWSIVAKWLNSIFLIIIPALAVWYSHIVRHKATTSDDIPTFRFGLLGFIVLIAIVCYSSGTSQTATIVACVGVLCVPVCLLSVWKRTAVNIESMSLLCTLVMWFCTLYAHFFSYESFPVLITVYLLFAPIIVVLCSWLFADKSLKWKLIASLFIVISGACVAGYMGYTIYQESLIDDDYGY